MKRSSSLHIVALALISGVIAIVAANLTDRSNILFARAEAQSKPPSLPALSADIRETSVSGVSSGGAMAIQMHVAHSSIMRGVGVIAGVAYDCADSRLPNVNQRLARGLVLCMNGESGGDAAFSIARTDQAAAVPGAIDPLSNLPRQKIWLFSGYNDGTVLRAAMDQVAAYYRHYVAAGNLFYQTDNRAPHALITDDYGGDCLAHNDQYINNCGYDAAGDLLRHIFGHLNPRSPSPVGQIRTFDQSEFTDGVSPQLIGLAETGYVYVPYSCAAPSPAQACRVHVVFHGCRQYAGNPQVNTAVVEHGGYNRWADTNNFIVLYPQVQPIPGSVGNPGNPTGCWDWWGYSDLPRSRDYARKTGYQIAAVKAMIDRLTSGNVPVSPPQSFGPPQNAAVADVTSNALEIVWQANSAAAGFNIARATSAGGPFVPVATMVSGASFADTALARDTTYHYEIRAVDGSGAQSAPVILSGKTAPTSPPRCDPYFSNNPTHVSRGRAYLGLSQVLALGSNDAMGAPDEDVYSHLIKEQRLLPYYRVGYCP